MNPGPGGQFDHLLKNMKSKVQSQESGVETEESSVLSPESRTQPDEVKKVDSGVESLDLVALDEAIKEANVKPKLGVYSPLAAAMLRYKAITTPRYSMGSEIKTIIERALKEAYSQLYEEVQKRIKNN